MSVWLFLPQLPFVPTDWQRSCQGTSWLELRAFGFCEWPPYGASCQSYIKWFSGSELRLTNGPSDSGWQLKPLNRKTYKSLVWPLLEQQDLLGSGNLAWLFGTDSWLRFRFSSCFLGHLSPDSIPDPSLLVAGLGPAPPTHHGCSSQLSPDRSSIGFLFLRAHMKIPVTSRSVCVNSHPQTPSNWYMQLECNRRGWS